MSIHTNSDSNAKTANNHQEQQLQQQQQKMQQQLQQQENQALIDTNMLLVTTNDNNIRLVNWNELTICCKYKGGMNSEMQIQVKIYISLVFLNI